MELFIQCKSVSNIISVALKTVNICKANWYIKHCFWTLIFWEWWGFILGPEILVLCPGWVSVVNSSHHVLLIIWLMHNDSKTYNMTHDNKFFNNVKSIFTMKINQSNIIKDTFMLRTCSKIPSSLFPATSFASLIPSLATLWQSSLHWCFSYF